MLGIRRPHIDKPGVIARPSRTGEGGFTGDQRDRPGSIERASVVEVFPDTMSALVSCKSGTFPATLPAQGPVNPDNPTGGVALPYRGSEVLITHVNGQAHIISYATPKDPTTLSATGDARRFELTYDKSGAEEGHYKDKGYTRRSGLNPKGLLPGDWLQVGRLGNVIGVLEGGINLFRAHDMAQVIAFAREQMVKIVARHYKLYTDFGTVVHTTDDRGASMIIRGTGDAVAESASEAWTIRGDLGATGDIANLRITTTTGFDLAKLWVSRLGDVYTLTKDHVTENTGRVDSTTLGTLRSVVTKAATRIYKGPYTKTVEKKYTENYDSHQRMVTNTSFDAVMDDSTEIVGGLKTTIIASGEEKQVTGGPINVVVGADTSEKTGVSVAINKGDYKVTTDISGDLIFKTPQGDIKLTTSLGKACLNTHNAADSVILGGESGNFHIVKYEQFKSFMTAIASALDSHQHYVTVGSPSLTGSVSTSGLFSGIVNAVAPTTKSSVVKVTS